MLLGYEKEIEIIKQDLGITWDGKVSYHALMGKYEGGTKIEGNTAHYMGFGYSRFRNIMLTKLLHEFRHVYQAISDQVRVIDTVILWNNIPSFDTNNCAMDESEDYLFLPWEVDAREYSYIKLQSLFNLRVPKEYIRCEQIYNTALSERFTSSGYFRSERNI